MSEPSAPGAPVPPTEPPAPPVAPAPPAAPPVPPVPQYGEYPPAGYVEAQPTPGPQGYAQPYGAASFPMQPAGRRRKTWDLIFTIILLVVGFFGAGIGVLYGVAFTNPQLLDQALQQQGYGGFSGSAGSAPAILIVSHILLYLVALGGSIPLLISKRVAFWLPLSIGVLAAIIFWATVVGVLLSDPSFVQPGR